MLTLRIAAAGMRAHPLRYVLTSVVVVLSVGFTAGTLALTDSVDQAATAEGAVSADNLRVPLLMLGAVSLIVAAFVIANTFRILLAQRTRELALLRTVGATRRQVLLGVVAEACAVGLAGGIAGLVLGIVAGIGFARAIGDDAHGIPIVVSTGTVVWPLTLGVLITVGSALVPAVGATRVSPLAAARAVPEADDDMPARRVRTAAGLALVAIGAVLLLGGAVAPIGYVGLMAVVAGAALSFLGLLILGSRIVPPALRLLGSLAVLVSGRAKPTTELATANAARNPRRAAATAGALLIGVTVVTGFVTVGESTRASIDVVLDQQVPADFVVTADVDDGVPADAITAIDALPETGASVSLYREPIESQTLGSVDLIGLSLDDYQAIARVSGNGSLADLSDGSAGDAVAVTEGLASDHGIGVGDSVDVAGEPLRVGYVVDDRTVPIPGIIASPRQFGMLVPESAGPEQYAVDAADGVETADAEAAVENVVEPMIGITVYSNLATKEQINRELDRAVGVVVAILGLAVVIAGIGMANTLSLAVHERRREIGLLRALGVTERGTRMMLGVEALLSSLVAAIIGVIVGVVFSAAAVASVPNVMFVVPWARLAACLAIAAVLGLVASLAPARRAARLSPVAALATE